MSSMNSIQFGTVYKTTDYRKAEAKAQKEQGIIVAAEDQWLVGTNEDRFSVAQAKETLDNSRKVDPEAQKTMLGFVALRLRTLLDKAESLD